VKFYKLRNLRLTNIKKKLEILVGKRTVQLEDSNRKLKKAEGSLRKNYKELKKLDVKKDEFISIAAHELKTPLTVMSGYANLLKDEKVIRNQNKRKRFLDIIEDESKRQAQLVSEILDLSRIDLGVMKYVIEELNLYEFIKSLEDQFGPKIKENGLSYEFRIEDKLPKIETDKEKLYEILMNLINNAIKFTSEGKITVKIERNGDYIQFSVADTGIGISRKYYNKLFTRFFQVDSSYTRSVGGTGLGLSLCKEYTEKLGGDIWLKSKVGKGTTFYFRIPIKTTVKKNIIKIK
jgi:signal transduction histidine kinase